MMATGMTHAGINFRPTSTPEQSLSYLNEKGYETALVMAPGHYTWGGLDELETKTDDTMFLDAPCLNTTTCENWNTTKAIDPTYTGTLWQNTVTNTIDVVSRANPEHVFYDVEIWYDPTVLEYYFNNGDPGRDCNCNVVDEGIGYDAFKQGWLQKGQDLTDIVKNVNPDATVYFYQELPEDGIEYYPNYQGVLTSRTLGYMQDGSGDNANPSLYILPNLEAFAENMTSMDLTDAVIWVSFNYVYGYSNYGMGDFFFAPSLSYDAGVMMRQAGARGFIVYPNADNLKDNFPMSEFGDYNGYVDLNGYGGYQYWLEHATAMAQGFRDGATYVPSNKILNSSFEALKIQADGYDYNGPNGIQLTGDIRYIPNFWEWSDTVQGYDNSTTYANLTHVGTTEGVYQWRHTRKGEVGTRTISSSEFEVNLDEAGSFTFSILAKLETLADLSASNSKVSFVIKDVNTGIEASAGDLLFQNMTEGAAFESSVSLSAGMYKLEIVIEDNTTEQIDVYFDKVTLSKD